MPIVRNLTYFSSRFFYSNFHLFDCKYKIVTLSTFRTIASHNNSNILSQLKYIKKNKRKKNERIFPSCSFIMLLFAEAESKWYNYSIHNPTAHTATYNTAFHNIFPHVIKWGRELFNKKFKKENESLYYLRAINYFHYRHFGEVSFSIYSYYFVDWWALTFRLIFFFLLNVLRQWRESYI